MRPSQNVINKTIFDCIFIGTSSITSHTIFKLYVKYDRIHNFQYNLTQFIYLVNYTFIHFFDTIMAKF